MGASGSRRRPFAAAPGVTFNRAGLLSHVGVARELSALSGKPLTLNRASADRRACRRLGAARVGEPRLCPRYAARDPQGQVRPRPVAPQAAEGVGLRPINNVVDVTNYVLYELGQPLPFDLSRLREHSIVVRKAWPGESIDTLDGKRRAGRHVVIADDGVSRCVASWAAPKRSRGSHDRRHLSAFRS